MHSVKFHETGKVARWTVPAGVRTIDAHVAGASGAPYQGDNNGGRGGLVKVSLPVHAGTRLSIVVGAAGTSAAPIYGGGNENGGGGSFVFAGTGPQIIAGGGGAGGDSYIETYPGVYAQYSEPGGNGGTSGAGESSVDGGSGGTLEGPGEDPNDPATTGSGPATSPTHLGTGGFVAFTGGSGGGGFFGGGGGWSAGGSSGGYIGAGGGGSGYLVYGATALATGTNKGNGEVNILWVSPCSS